MKLILIWIGVSWLVGGELLGVFPVGRVVLFLWPLGLCFLVDAFGSSSG